MVIKNIDIDDIVINKRIRRNLGELDSLMKSMGTFGLMNPIVINQKNELIAGERRLTAAKKLGWTTIPAAVVSHEGELEKLELEIEENLHRRNLTPDELAEGFNRIDRLRKPNVFEKIWNAVISFFKRLFGRKK